MYVLRVDQSDSVYSSFSFPPPPFSPFFPHPLTTLLSVSSILSSPFPSHPPFLSPQYRLHEYRNSCAFVQCVHGVHTTIYWHLSLLLSLPLPTVILRLFFHLLRLFYLFLYFFLYLLEAIRLAVVPTMPSVAPNTIKMELMAMMSLGGLTPSFFACFCKALMYMMGGKTNIILLPNTPPATEPTTPMSVNLEARKDIRMSSNEDILLIPPMAGNLLTAWETNQFLIDKNISGKLANTDVPKANLASVPKGSFWEKEFSAKDADFGPNKTNPNATVPM